MSNAPNIRFKGFAEPWEQRKFGDENDLITGYPFESDKFTEEGIKLVRGMNVKRGYLDFSDEICMSWKSPEGLEDYLLEDGDILIQMDGALIGKSYARIAQTQLPALLVQRVTRARTNREISNSDFMYQTIQRDFLAHIEMNKTETAVPHLSLTDIRDFKIMVPTLEEQKKIGTFFTNLDNLITFHQHKCDEMSELKKYMLQKMFPKNGEQFPEIRFSGFTDPWEQRKLGEVFIQTSKIVNPKEDNVELWSLTVEDGLTPKTERYTRDFLVKKDDNFKEVRPGDIVYNPMNMTLGAVGYNGMKQSVAVSGYYTTMITQEGYDAYYINTWLKSPQAILLYKTYATGSLIEKQRVQFPTLSIIPAAFPGYEEQKKIGDYFRSLDNLITLHQRKCDELIEFKKFMLQNMFPKKG